MKNTKLIMARIRVPEAKYGPSGNIIQSPKPWRWQTEKRPTSCGARRRGLAVSMTIELSAEQAKAKAVPVR